jgi:hypothetical protein
MEPEIFAPGLISDPNSSEYSGSFSADGTDAVGVTQGLKQSVVDI